MSRQQFLLHADVTGRRLREELLRKVKLSNVEHRNFRLIQEVVFRMAKKPGGVALATQEGLQAGRSSTCRARCATT